MNRYALAALLLFIVAAAAGTGYALGLDEGDDDPADTVGCPIVQVPVSDHVEGQCIPEAAPLLDMFDEPSTPPGPTAEGWSLIGELWLDQPENRLCWVNETEETRCTSPAS